jgi:signal transduction histidine kinase
MQLIAVTAAAVFFSNAGVATWYALGREQLNEAALLERVMDRAVSTATLLSAIPPRARQPAVKTMSTPVWHYALHNGKDVALPMTDAEEKLAARLKSMLPPEKAKFPVSVKFKSVKALKDAPLLSKRTNEAIEFTIPVVRNTQVIETFVRPELPPWPAEIMVAAIIAVLITSVAAAFLARRVTRPLSELAAAATVVAKGEAAPRVPEEGPDDVRNAATAFNMMTDQVRRMLESQRQLLSAVGHDLRTPITAMRINLEFVDDNELRERLLKNLDELQELTEAVLSAARGAGGEKTRTVDLSSLVDSVCADLDDLGEPVTWAAHQPAPCSCRPNEIRRAVRNLIENAVAYGGKAQVELGESATEYEIRVDDDGPGIPEADRERVFEPFVRLETSRNAETGGSGLGLTLVKTIVEGHGGSVLLENRPEGGLRARLRLPRLVGVATGSKREPVADHART